MTKHLLPLLSALLLLNSCSRNTLFPTDTKVYDSPKNYACKYEEYDFNSSEEVLLRGWYFKTEGVSKGVVVVANGMKFNMSERFKAWTWLLERGYDFFIFDYRGYGASTGEVDMQGFVDDVSAAIAYAHALNTRSPMIVVGQSMGGAFVIDALAENSYPYVRLLVIDAAMTGFGEAGQEIMQQHLLLWPWSWLPKATAPAGVDAIDHVERVQTPILFLTGLQDEIIQPKHSIALYDKANEPKAIWLVEGAKHVRSLDAERVRNDLDAVFQKAAEGTLHLNRDIRYYDQNMSHAGVREELR